MSKENEECAKEDFQRAVVANEKKNQEIRDLQAQINRMQNEAEKKIRFEISMVRDEYIQKEDKLAKAHLTTLNNI
jgi:hypothetical protein